MNSGNSVIKQNIWDDIILLAGILDINFEVKWKQRKWNISAVKKKFFKTYRLWSLQHWVIEHAVLTPPSHHGYLTKIKIFFMLFVLKSDCWKDKGSGGCI